MSKDTGESVLTAITPILIIGMFVLAIAQLIAGYIGIQHHLGTIVAVLAVLAAFALRFTLPLTIGAFFGAMNVWGWPWYGALAFALPGLAFMALMIPGALAASLVFGRKC